MNPRYSRYFTFIKPILKNKGVKTYSPIIFSIITITIFSLYAIRPTLKTIISLQKSIEEQQALLEQINQKSSNLSEGKSNYQKIDPNIKTKLATLLPNTTSLPNLISSLYALSRVEQATITGIQFQPVDLDGPPKVLSKSAAIKQIELSINVQGSFTQLNNFLKSLNSLDRLVSIQTISLTKTQDNSLIMSINALAYYFKN